LISTNQEEELMRNAEILGKMMKLGYTNLRPDGTKINETKTNEEKAKLARSRILKYVKDNISNAKFKKQLIKEFGSLRSYNS
jgi:hypothetical protein